MSVDPLARPRFYRDVKAMPAVAGVALREMTLKNFRETMAETMNLQIFFNVLFAGVIAFGVVYNSARVSLSERSRELASLRVLGFTRGEISGILLGELALQVAIGIPLGLLLGTLWATWYIDGLHPELFGLPLHISAQTYAAAAGIALVSGVVSALLVRRKLDQLDLVGVLKISE